MGLKVDGLIEVDQMLVRLDTTARRRVLNELVAQGQKLRLLAIKMAPVDEGNLEKAIKLRGDSASLARDEFGRFARTEVEVYIDFDVEVPDRPGHTVGDYAYIIHEHLTPMGPLQLGTKSIEKQIANPDVLVGGGFMDRAGEVIETGLDSALENILANLF